MHTNILVGSPYMSLMPFLQQIPHVFETLGSEIQSGRNITKVMEKDGFTLVVKNYKRITIANRIMYRFFRKSKAQRAYENALKLREMDISTPDPVAYIEKYKGIFLESSYFVSIYIDYLGVDDALASGRFDSKSLLTKFAQYLYRLHNKGVFHKDLNLANVMCKEVDGKISFSLIDLNRLRFEKPSQKKRFRNLKFLNLPIDQYVMVSSEYARCYDIDIYYATMRMLSSRYAERKNRKRITYLKNMVLP